MMMRMIAEREMRSKCTLLKRGTVGSIKETCATTSFCMLMMDESLSGSVTMPINFMNDRKNSVAKACIRDLSEFQRLSSLSHLL